MKKNEYSTDISHELYHGQKLNISFNNANGKIVGQFKEVDGYLTFTGDVDESAKIFINELLSKYNETRNKNILEDLQSLEKINGEFKTSDIDKIIKKYTK